LPAKVLGGWYHLEWQKEEEDGSLVPIWNPETDELQTSKDTLSNLRQFVPKSERPEVSPLKLRSQAYKYIVSPICTRFGTISLKKRLTQKAHTAKVATRGWAARGERLRDCVNT
jgi:hypothetical protein